MSCETGLRRMVSAASRSGIAAGASKKAFYIGTAAVGTILGGLLLSRSFLRRQGQPISPATPPNPGLIKPLASLKRVEPVPADKLSGQRCTHCKTPAQGKGAWYDLGGRLYCQECAPGQASKAGVTLARPAASRSETAVKYSPTGRRTALKPRLVKVGPLDNLEGYAVWAGNKNTGLTLVPEVKLEANGQAKINKARWFVQYDRAGKPVAGPYESVGEARGMASLLANLDWTRPVEQFADEEIRSVTWMTKVYREDLEFKSRKLSF